MTLSVTSQAPASPVPAKGPTLMVGLGVSGQAIARHLSDRGIDFAVADTRSAPPGLESLREHAPQAEVHLGPLEALDLSRFGEVVLSPGIDPRQAVFDGVRERLVGEIALFVRALDERQARDAQGKRPTLVAITGSNAKSTVTTLIAQMAARAGRDVAVGGNLGTAALTLLREQPDAELYVLELSSFQLETTPELKADVACFLNLSEDHLDRHDGMRGYQAAKRSIFRGAGLAVINADDAWSWPAENDAVARVSFSVQLGESADKSTDEAARQAQWRLAEQGGTLSLCHVESGQLRGVMPAAEVRLAGRHNQANALAALAMGTAIGLDETAMVAELASFAGLPHRGELIAEVAGVRWINDSKGTNVGATLAAIAGLGPTLEGKLILLAGGQGKGADFTPLAAPLARYAREAVVFGQDAPLLTQALADDVSVTPVMTLLEAMRHARQIAQAGDCVLLSPACASLDQFPNYMARGDAFRDWVTQNIMPGADCNSGPGGSDKEACDA
ncbi:UDP-N-acetylmuramoyl-L-alanine--D-glutamate ligase [Cobetia sp. 4B]|uniref:UDP-N-acetylmuramoyl-L-alanine--D-glutamate ligase n=1 Tax=Cobetia sp. 4B TaxID=2758724 RepID=UPI001C0468FF|nr:UDP-N-acetylmuramoyl-L-alanine--D-glutamate ligase [Cobetia sp. 4B]MBR9753927.1 UDP-N-acetylmuramoyl-L-alanine--D-glutamate ligase [Gammaproteobacteria bacterium]QWN37584.1 UDP-N-acetylmuramoyl-L-alanine--D-glutamate ligase [Cobetia sp. 4B]